MSIYRGGGKLLMALQSLYEENRMCVKVGEGGGRRD